MAQNGDNEIIKILAKMKEAVKMKNEDEKFIKQLDLKLWVKLCHKHYLDECMPAYCVFRLTDSCDYVKFKNII